MAYEVPMSTLASAVVLFLSFGLGSSTSSHADQVKQYNVTEGNVFSVECNTAATFVYWTDEKGDRFTGKTLSFFKIKRKEAGDYTCHKDFFKPETVETININVQYAAKVHHVSKPGPLRENQTFSLSVNVEGNPAPNTTFTSEEDGELVFQHIGEGMTNVTVGPLQCADGGTYRLMSSNNIGNDTHMEEILVNCPPSPSPRLPIHDSVQPRLGENVTLKVVSMGYPFPEFKWSYEGKDIHSDDKHFESDIELKNFRMNEFGDYMLTMKNDYGETNHTFKVTANGPPGQVTELKVVNIVEAGVNLTWVSGYDYGQKQSFAVKSYKGGVYKDIVSFDTKDGDHGFSNVSHVIGNLESGVMYNLSVVANNSRGQGPFSSNSVLFTTAPYSVQTVVEGNSIFILCNGTLPTDHVYWTNEDGTTVAEGKQLAFFNTTRNVTGLYLCNEIYKSTIITKETVFVDVLYPEKIVDLKVSSEDVNVNESYIITLKVEGNPIPTTTITQNGNVLFQANHTGMFNASVEHVSCSEFGPVELTCSNMLRNESRTEMMLVHCPPSPNGGIHNKLRPRLGENATLKIESIGYPYPVYVWTFNGKVLQNETAKNENEYEVQNVKIKDFGLYKLIMSNVLGTSIEDYMVEAYGPPDPVTKLDVNNVTVSTANITFVSGYDYGAQQSFIVQSFNGKSFDDIARFEDKSKDHSLVNVSHVIGNLTFGTNYNLTIVANNSRGMGQRSPFFVLFTTKVPYNTLEVLEGDNVTLTCNATANMTNVHWENNAGQRESSGNQLEIKDIGRNASGFYLCVGNAAGSARHKLEDVFIDVQYPAKILNMSVSDNYLHANDTFYIELEVEGHPTPNITFIKLRDGSQIFSMNKSGAFNITIDPVECTNLGKYQLICSNTISSETKEEDIFVYCPPVVDPKAHITKQFYPRLGNMTMVQIENYGYPYPNYTWTYKTKTLPHKDTDQESHITVNVTVDDFGDYSVDMDNEFGDVTISFQLIPKGPPEAVNGLKMDNATYDSATLSWQSGYNYGSPQTFMVMTQDGKTLKTFADAATQVHGVGVYTVTGLTSSTPYNLTVVAHNKDGNSVKAPGFVKFSTAAAPSPQKGKTNKKAVIGGVLGALCFLGVLVVIAIFLKRRRDRRRTTYENLDEDYN